MMYQVMCDNLQFPKWMCSSLSLDSDRNISNDNLKGCHE